MLRLLIGKYRYKLRLAVEKGFFGFTASWNRDVLRVPEQHSLQWADHAVGVSLWDDRRKDGKWAMRPQK